METNKEYIAAVKRFNEDVYPRIRHATAHVKCMPNILRDIAKEYGENSYAVRRIQEHWKDEIQQTLLDALGCLEAKERRAIPKPFPVERPSDRVKEGTNASLSLHDLAQAELLDRDAWFYTKEMTVPKHGIITMVNADAKPSIAVLDFDDGASLTFTPETDIGRVVFLSEFDVYKAQTEGVNNNV